MKGNRYLILFVVIVIVMWNPLIFLLLFHDYPPILSSNIWIFHIAISVSALIALRHIVAPKKTNNIFSNVVISISTSLIVLGSLILANFLMRLSFNSQSASKASTENLDGLVFQPNSLARYQTVEFNYTVETNSLGLRDIEIDIDKESRYRILCFGDSWTNGYGVNLEDTYPKQLEKNLHDRGFTNVEVINCGRGGQYSSTYLEAMKRIIPILNPDLVIVGLLQLEDFIQLFLYSADESAPVRSSEGNADNLLSLVIEASFGQIRKALTSQFKTAPINVRTEWEQSAQEMIRNLNPAERMRFLMLPDSVKSLTVSGDLNPHMVNHYVKFPDLPVLLNNSEMDATKQTSRLLYEDLKEMRLLCDMSATDLIVVNMPLAVFTGHQVVRTPIIETLRDHLQRNNHIDSIYRAVSERNNILYFELTSHFRDLPEKDRYFYRFDGHPNKNGYSEIASSIGDQLVREMSTLTFSCVNDASSMRN